MKKSLGSIFLLIGFLIFSFSGTICLLSKLNAQEVLELVGNVAEEEDESGKEDGADSEALMQLFDHVATNYVSVEFCFPPLSDHKLPTYDPNKVTPPPRG